MQASKIISGAKHTSLSLTTPRGPLSGVQGADCSITEIVQHKQCDIRHNDTNNNKDVLQKLRHNAAHALRNGTLSITVLKAHLVQPQSSFSLNVEKY